MFSAAQRTCEWIGWRTRREDDMAGCGRAQSVRWAVLLAAVLALLPACEDHSIDPVVRPPDLLDRLNALPGVVAREISPNGGYPRAFELDITQPVDHDNPDGPTFTQRAYLSHVDTLIPMVFAPSGYAASRTSGQELAGILQSNCLNVTHRYFRYSRPEPTDWELLRVRQSAADHHRIVTLLKQVYPRQWISTGASKSGETVLFHRRWYPEDVDATVAYVAPLLFSADDPRFMPYVRSRGTEEGREKIHGFQRMLLERRESLLPVFGQWFEDRGYSMSIPLGPTFESEVRSYEWGFWQRHIVDYDSIPGPEATDQEVIDHLATVVRLWGASDEGREYYQAYVYQAYTEIGYPETEYGYLEDLFAYGYLDVKEEYDFPADLEFTYRSETIPDVLNWLQTQGNEIIYIYGSVDPWTAGAVELTGQTNALKIVQEGADHGVRIEGLDQRELVLSTLEEWLGINIPSFASQGISVPDFAEPGREDMRVFNRPPVW